VTPDIYTVRRSHGLYILVLKLVICYSFIVGVNFSKKSCSIGAALSFLCLMIYQKLKFPPIPAFFNDFGINDFDING